MSVEHTSDSLSCLASMVAKLVVLVFATLAASQVAGGFNLAKLVGLTQAKGNRSIRDLAAAADQTSGNKFWSDAIRHLVEHCAAEFAQELESSFEKLRTKGESDFERLYRTIQSQTMNDCSAYFGNRVYEFYGLIESADGIGELAEEYELERENPGANEDQFAAQIAHQMSKVSPSGEIDEFSKFKTIYSEASPCPKVYKALEEPNMRAYERFLRLTMLPEYRKEVHWTHLVVSDILATCDYIKANGRLLELAFDRYKSNATSPPSNRRSSAQ